MTEQEIQQWIAEAEEAMEKLCGYREIVERVPDRKVYTTDEFVEMVSRKVFEKPEKGE